MRNAVPRPRVCNGTARGSSSGHLRPRLLPLRAPDREDPLWRRRPRRPARVPPARALPPRLCALPAGPHGGKRAPARADGQKSARASRGYEELIAHLDLALASLGKDGASGPRLALGDSVLVVVCDAAVEATPEAAARVPGISPVRGAWGEAERAHGPAQQVSADGLAAEVFADPRLPSRACWRRCAASLLSARRPDHSLRPPWGIDGTPKVVYNPANEKEHPWYALPSC
jgi:hypothetical protein